MVEFIPTLQDVEEIKGILNQMGSTAHDEYILTMYPLILEVVIDHTNNDFGGILVDGTIKLPGGVKIYIAKTIEQNLMAIGLKSRTMGSVSYTYDLETPLSVKKLLSTYKRVRFNAAL